MGLFSGLSSAKARIQATYVRPSHFIARIDACKTGENRKNEGFFVVEMTVIHDCAPDKYDMQTYGHSVGERVSWMAMSKHDSFLGNVKAFMANVLGLTGAEAENLGEEEAVQITSNDQPLAGTIIEVIAKNITTKAGNPFTAVNFVGEVQPQQMLDLWATMGDTGTEREQQFFPEGELQRRAAAA